jgi:hypothetical protein
MLTLHLTRRESRDRSQMSGNTSVSSSCTRSPECHTGTDVAGDPTAAAWAFAVGFGECPSCEDRMRRHRRRPSQSPDREQLYGAASSFCPSLPTAHDRHSPYKLLSPVLIADPYSFPGLRFDHQFLQHLRTRFSNKRTVGQTRSRGIGERASHRAGGSARRRSPRPCEDDHAAACAARQHLG